MLFTASLIQLYVMPSFLDLPAAEALTADNMMQYPQAVLMANLIQQVLVFALPVLIFGWLYNGKPLAFAGVGRKEAVAVSWWLVFALGIVLLFVATSMGGLMKSIDLGSWADAIQKGRDGQIESYLQNSDWGGMLINLILLALIPAVCEELFFRGAIMRFALGFNLKPSVAFIVTSFIFTILHASVYEFLPIFTASMILCAVYYYSGNLINSIIVHFLNNGIQILYVYFFYDTATVASSWPALLSVFVPAVILMVLLLRQLMKNSKEDAQLWRVQLQE